jgi:hypothetical protein
MRLIQVAIARARWCGAPVVHPDLELRGSNGSDVRGRIVAQHRPDVEALVLNRDQERGIDQD